MPAQSDLKSVDILAGAQLASIPPGELEEGASIGLFILEAAGAHSN